MTKSILKVTIAVFIFSLFIVLFNIKSYAQFDACDFLPCEQTIDGDTDSTEVESGISTYFRFGVSLIFTGFIAYGIFVIVKSALKIVQSGGEEETITSGVQGLKSVFIGVTMLIVGIIGLILLSAFFGASGIFSTEVQNPDGVNNIPIINN